MHTCVINFKTLNPTWCIIHYGFVLKDYEREDFLLSIAQDVKMRDQFNSLNCHELLGIT